MVVDSLMVLSKFSLSTGKKPKFTLVFYQPAGCGAKAW
ncbi:Hypothetical protein I595_1869 [Croceitalea dokdonensis DOKDO 023]|uniref:Uncharacterized protein n=1 Tax=Croceitalea dokdonensis DOKDO 023 TaxID=1300341 RepID=A0A0P7A676_9FLAO|nr:Hypothetical protein I595_1869 [Croceitalea dokdonensis DOKDO 023]